MNSIVFFQDEVQEGGFIALTGGRAQYIHEWHKVKSGLVLQAGVWGGKRGKADVVDVQEDKVSFKLVLDSDPLIRNHIALVAVPRPQTIKKVIQSSVSLGLKELHFIHTQNVVPGYLDSKMLRDEELKEELLKALEQACDTVPPEVVIHTNWNYFLKEKLETILHPHTIKICTDTFATECIPQTGSQSVCVAIGPESGWTEAERKAFKDFKFQFVSLGERMLRVDQALTVALSKFIG